MARLIRLRISAGEDVAATRVAVFKQGEATSAQHPTVPKRLLNGPSTGPPDGAYRPTSSPRHLAPLGSPGSEGEGEGKTDKTRIQASPTAHHCQSLGLAGAKPSASLWGY